MSNGKQIATSKHSHALQRPFSRLRAARIDGRTQNAFFRRNELNKLYRTLLAHTLPIQDAIKKDSGISLQEAQIEYFLSLSAIRDHYNTISPDSELEKEYDIANGNSAKNRRVGHGLVHISPSRYTMLYSIIAPLSAAIAAGNCIILELQNDLLGISKILKRILPDCLDADTFALAEKGVEDDRLLAECIRVDQNSEISHQSNSILQGPVGAHTIAIVDRDADLTLAADYLVASRFLFRGRSPYSPDMVLVNEFVKKDFLEAVVAKITRLMAETTDVEKPHAALPDEISKSIRNSASTLVISGSIGAVLDIKSRDDPLLRKKIYEPVFIVHSTSSLDDAIDFTNSFGTSLASFLFTTPKAAKYLSQFIDSHLSLINYIPVSLLVGPPCPRSHTPSPYHRYYPEMFSVPRPILYDMSRPLRKPPPEEKGLTLKLTADFRSLTRDLNSFALDFSKPLPGSEEEMARPIKGNIGFFEQGLLTGVAVLALTGALLSYGLYRGVSGGLTSFRYRR